mgnify:CR=1 FL=1
MPLTLHDDLSCCRVDNRLIFLDLESDRYFRLPPDLEHAFDHHMQGELVKQLDRERLRHLGIPAIPTSIRHSLSGEVIPPLRSALEHQDPASTLRSSTILDTSIAVLNIKSRLAAGHLSTTIRYVAARRSAQAMAVIEMPSKARIRQLLQATCEFRCARLYVPIRPSCLLDSLAMVMFLAKRGLHASIVIGVTSAPFSAHCWVQTGDLVLNDTVGNARAFTPIRVI